MNTTQGLVPILSPSASVFRSALLRLTLDLFKSFTMQSRNGVVLLFQASNAPSQRNSDLELLIVQLVRAIGLVVFEGCFHLFDRLDYSMRLLCEFLFLAASASQIKSRRRGTIDIRSDQLQLIVQGLRERREKLEMLVLTNYNGY